MRFEYSFLLLETQIWEEGDQEDLRRGMAFTPMLRFWPSIWKSICNASSQSRTVSYLDLRPINNPSASQPNLKTLVRRGLEFMQWGRNHHHRLYPTLDPNSEKSSLVFISHCSYYSSSYSDTIPLSLGNRCQTVIELSNMTTSLSLTLTEIMNCVSLWYCILGSQRTEDTSFQDFLPPHQHSSYNGSGGLRFLYSSFGWRNGVYIHIPTFYILPNSELNSEIPFFYHQLLYS